MNEHPIGRPSLDKYERDIYTTIAFLSKSALVAKGKFQAYLAGTLFGKPSCCIVLAVKRRLLAEHLRTRFVT